MPQWPRRLARHACAARGTSRGSAIALAASPVGLSACAALEAGAMPAAQSIPPAARVPSGPASPMHPPASLLAAAAAHPRPGAACAGGHNASTFGSGLASCPRCGMWAGASGVVGARCRCCCFTLASPPRLCPLSRTLWWPGHSQRLQLCPSWTWRCTTPIRCTRGPREGKSRRRKGLMPLIPKQDVQPPLTASTRRVYAISDLHTDYEANMEWVRTLSSSAYQPHTLIVAGDVANSLETFTTTMRILKEKFLHVFFVAGNHDLWCKSIEGPDLDSVTKLKMLNDTCESLGVCTSPQKLNGVWIYPLLSWYHQSFDKERDIEGYNIRPAEKAASDFRLCKWPLPLDHMIDGSLARYFDELNQEEFQSAVANDQDGCQIITFSHFLPRFELCPEKRMLFYPNLPKIIGSDWLEARLRTIHGRHGSPTACHVFGHTHFCWDATLDGVRYIQSPLAYPKERERRINGGIDWLPLCIYDSDKGD